MKRFILIVFLSLTLTACKADITKTYTITEVEFIKINANTVIVKKDGFQGEYTVGENHRGQIREVMGMSKNIDKVTIFDVIIGDDKIIAISPSENKK